MIRALIVDDEPLARRAVEIELQREPDVEIVGKCGSGLEALRAIQGREPELVFLDVQMPELDGIELLRAVDAPRLPVVVFVTAHDRYAIQAFELHAIDYLLKPFDSERFQKALRHARLQLASRQATSGERLQALLSNGAHGEPFARRFVVKATGRWSIVEAARVDWIGAADNYVELHVGRQSHLLRETLGHLEARLDPARFLRIRHSAIVNLDRLEEIRPLPSGECQVVLKDGTVLVASRRYRSRLNRLGGR